MMAVKITHRLVWSVSKIKKFYSRFHGGKKYNFKVTHFKNYLSDIWYQIRKTILEEAKLDDDKQRKEDPGINFGVILFFGNTDIIVE